MSRYQYQIRIVPEGAYARDNTDRRRERSRETCRLRYIKGIYVMREKKAKMGLGKKIAIGFLITIVILLLAAYFGGVYYFSKHFLPGSAINGLNASYKTVDQVQELIADEIATYTLHLAELDGGKEALVAEQLGLKYVPDDKIQELKDSQNIWKWFLSMQNKKKYTMSATTTYSAKKLKASVEALKCFQEANVTKPKDASINDNGTSYEIVPEVVGNELDKEKVLQLVIKAVEGGETQIDLVKEECYLKPAVYQDDEKLNTQVQQLNTITSASITYDFGSVHETVDRAKIQSWLIQDADGNYTIDQGQVAQYVYDLAYNYDTFGSSRQFRTSGGETITVGGGDYGYVIAQDTETQALINSIIAGETVEKEPAYVYRGNGRDGSDDILGTYVEISLTQQRMWFYKDGYLMVDTPVVTGNPNKGNATPAGVYAIDNKQTPAVLKGEDYASPVTYWLPFNGNVGIHDAAGWRPNDADYGGEIYKTNGSHGCVNTPISNAKIIYDNIEIGDPVIVY